jgi:fibronectin-binding autotransporter adhesin
LKPTTSFSMNHPISTSQYSGTINTNGQVLTLNSTVAGTLTVSGSGTLGLAAGGNTASMTVSNATLALMNSSTTDRFSLTLENTGTLSGTGSAGTTFLEAGATLDPGGANPGTIYSNGSLELGAGGFLDFDLGTSQSSAVDVNSGSVGI